MTTVDLTEKQACIEWQGSMKPNGYGRVWVDDHHEYAHRYIYRQHFGEIPEGLDICHRCDNRRCVNPSHLFAGTRKDNMNDCVAKGRQARGERSGPAKLTEETVRAIRALNALGVSQCELARRHGVTQATIWALLRGRTWRHV